MRLHPDPASVSRLTRLYDEALREADIRISQLSALVAVALHGEAGGASMASWPPPWSSSAPRSPAISAR